jgi:hypothetical protein
VNNGKRYIQTLYSGREESSYTMNAMKLYYDGKYDLD